MSKVKDPKYKNNSQGVKGIFSLGGISYQEQLDEVMMEKGSP